MEHTKIQLSQREIDFASDNSIILTKNNVIAGVIGLMQQIQKNYRLALDESGTGQYAEISSTSYKISRGENYRGFPWVVLDYPRMFNKDDVFAIRTMFWWGHFFSITLHVSGKWKTIQGKNINKGMSELKKRNFYLCISDDQWLHHFEKDNYRKLSTLTGKVIAQHISGRHFIKISRKYAITQWKQIPEKFTGDFEMLIKLCGI